MVEILNCRTPIQDFISVLCYAEHNLYITSGFFPSQLVVNTNPKPFTQPMITTPTPATIQFSPATLKLATLQRPLTPPTWDL